MASSDTNAECKFASKDEFLCEGGGSLCEDITDEAACNARVSPEGHGRCYWVVEDLYDDDTCIPAAQTSGHCINLWPVGSCNDHSSCTPQGPRVYYTDHGAGTYGLWTVDDCDWTTDEFDACDFSQGFGLPLLCDCACE